MGYILPVLMSVASATLLITLISRASSVALSKSICISRNKDAHSEKVRK